jgi:hypothetical protein
MRCVVMVHRQRLHSAWQHGHTSTNRHSCKCLAKSPAGLWCVRFAGHMFGKSTSTQPAAAIAQPLCLERYPAACTPFTTSHHSHLPLSGPELCSGNCHPGASKNAANRYSSSALSVGSSADQGRPACSPPPFQLNALMQLPWASCRTRVAI